MASAYSAPWIGWYIRPDLVDLMNMFISWGMAIQKKKWLDRVVYK